MPIIQDDFSTYLAVDAISPSSFKSESICTPAHFLAKKRARFTETSDTIFGRAFHCKVLTPHLYNKEFAELPMSRFPDFCKKTLDGWPNFKDKDNIAIKNKFVQNNYGKEILTPEYSAMMAGMYKSVRELPYINKILDLRNGSVETSLYFFAEFDSWGKFVRFIDVSSEEYNSMDQDTKRLFLPTKTRPDYFENTYAADLKTTLNSSPSGFPYEIKKYGYHIQAAVILDALKALTGNEYEAFYFIAVEKQDPFCSMIYTCTERMIDYGRDEYIEKLTMIYRAMTSGSYPGYEALCPLQNINGDLVSIPWAEIDMPRSYYYGRDMRNLNNSFDYES